MENTMKVNCGLNNEINHEGLDQKYVEFSIFCPLVEDSNGAVGVICSACCLRCQQISEVLADLILRQVVNSKELKRDSTLFYPHLPDKLKIYAETIGKITGKSWLEIADICHRCDGTPTTPKPATAKATEITHVGVNEV